MAVNSGPASRAKRKTEPRKMSCRLCDHEPVQDVAIVHRQRRECLHGICFEICGEDCDDRSVKHRLEMAMVDAMKNKLFNVK
jgi:hypothetical protein